MKIRIKNMSIKNNVKLNKKLFNIGSLFGFAAFIFWVLETATFLAIEGWHITATHPIEKMCDSIVSTLGTIYFLVTFLACVLTCTIVNDALNEEESNNNL